MLDQGAVFRKHCFQCFPTVLPYNTRDPLQCISDEGPGWHGAGMPHVLTSHHHLHQSICWGHCQADGSQQIYQKQVKTEVQLHDSAEGAGDMKEEKTTTWEWQRSNFRDTSSHAKSVMTQAQITCKVSRTAPLPRTGISPPSMGEAMGQELPAAHPSMGLVRQGAGTCREGYTWLQERR